MPPTTLLATQSEWKLNMQVENATPDHNGLEPDGLRSKSFVSRVSAIGTAVILTGFLVMTVSRAAFVATTENTGNAASTGQLSLTDNDLDAAMFTNFVDAGAGETEASCITVTYDGAFDPGLVELYTAGITGDVADYLDLVIEAGTGDTLTGGFDNCGLFIPDLLTGEIYNGTVGTFDTLTAAGSGSGISTTWDPTATGEEKTFRFTVTVRSDPDAADRDGTFGFIWETQ